MGRTVPVANQAALDFFNTRLAAWAKDPAKLGLTAAQVADLQNRVDAAGGALESAYQARLASLDATRSLATAMASVRDLGGDLVKTIRTHAETTGDHSIYTDASIPPVADASPAGPPEQPTNLKAAITGRGTIALTWKGVRTGGTWFLVERQETDLAGVGGHWAFVTVTAEKQAVDATVPTGLAAVSYRVRAQSPAGDSPLSAPATLAFGNRNIEAASPARQSPAAAAA